MDNNILIKTFKSRSTSSNFRTFIFLYEKFHDYPCWKINRKAHKQLKSPLKTTVEVEKTEITSGFSSLRRISDRHPISHSSKTTGVAKQQKQQQRIKGQQWFATNEIRQSAPSEKRGEKKSRQWANAFELCHDFPTFFIIIFLQVRFFQTPNTDLRHCLTPVSESGGIFSVRFIIRCSRFCWCRRRIRRCCYRY